MIEIELTYNQTENVATPLDANQITIASTCDHPIKVQRPEGLSLDALRIRHHYERFIPIRVTAQGYLEGTTEYRAEGIMYGYCIRPDLGENMMTFIVFNPENEEQALAYLSSLNS